MIQCLHRHIVMLYKAGARAFQPDCIHGVAEQLAILGLLDSVDAGPDQLNPEAFKRAITGQAERGVESRLATHCRQQGIGLFAFNDAGHGAGGNRFDIGCVSHAGISHDRGRVRVYQNDPVAFLTQGLAGLGAGIVKFARLTDDDRPGTNDHDGGKVFTTRHCCSPSP